MTCSEFRERTAFENGPKELFLAILPSCCRDSAVGRALGQFIGFTEGHRNVLEYLNIV